MNKYLPLSCLVQFIFILNLLSGCNTVKNQSVIAKGAMLEQVYDQCVFTEGPAADKYGNVYFTDQPNNRIMKWSTDGTVSVYLDSCGRSNGLYFDRDDHLIACADENNQIWMIDNNMHISVLVNKFEEKKFNGPNDLWVDSKNGIYFTDPYYKRDYWLNPQPEMQKQNLYYLSPDGQTVTIADSNLVQPNGIIGTSEKKLLYVADIGDSKTYSYSINDDGTLSNRQLFISKGSDGMTLDEKGNLYITGKGVTVYNCEGLQINHIDVNQNWTANVTFGGKQQKTLFITAMNSLYTLEMNVKGIK